MGGNTQTSQSGRQGSAGNTASREQAENTEQSADSAGGIDGATEQVEKDIKPIGRGVVANIYNQFKGKAKEDIAFLLKRKEGEAIGALHHPKIGDISLVWGNSKAWLEKIANKHAEVLDNLQEIINQMDVVSGPENRIKLESDTHFTVVSREYLGQPRDQWLLTAYEKKNSAFDNTTDTDETSDRGKQNDTATLQNTISDSKDTTSSQNNNDIENKNVHQFH